jgi:hypothetical protein
MHSELFSRVLHPVKKYIIVMWWLQNRFLKIVLGFSTLYYTVQPKLQEIKKKKFLELNFFLIVTRKAMSSIALGVWVAFLKQPDALAGRAAPKNS